MRNTPNIPRWPTKSRFSLFTSKLRYFPFSQATNPHQNMQSLSDYGLGDSDIEDSDNENDEKTVQLPRVNPAPVVLRSAPRIVTTSSRLVSYGEDDEDELNASHGPTAILVGDITHSPTQETRELENTQKESEENLDANENNVEDKTQTSHPRTSNPNIVLPPEPTGRCSISLQERIKTFLEKKQNGVDLNHTIQKRKDFRNPSIYEKLVSYLKIQENGTNYPPSLFDPDAWAKEPSYDVLAKTQKEAYEKKEKEKAKRTQIEFKTGTKKPQTTVATAGGDESKKRKSKWDISAAPTVLPAANPAITKVLVDAAISAAKKAKQ